MDTDKFLDFILNNTLEYNKKIWRERYKSYLPEMLHEIAKVILIKFKDEEKGEN